jgi:hypothetical protein
MSRIPLTQEAMRDRDRIAHLELRVAGYQTIVAEKTAAVEQLQKQNAELRDIAFDLQCSIEGLQLEADGSPG